MSETGNLIVTPSSIDSAVETSRVHLMPCNIDHDADAKIDSYFDSTIRGGTKSAEDIDMDSNGQDLTGSFRGRALKGSIVRLPAGYSGYVLKEDRKPYTDEEDRVIRATHKFSHFTYWNLETPPSENDAVYKAMQWIDIASVLHGTEEDIENATPDTIR